MSGPAGRSPNTDERLAPRHPVWVPVAIESGSTCDEGRLCDISATGGRIEKVTMQPAIGVLVTITFAFSLSEAAFEVIGRVVRHTNEGGFAVQFEAIDPRLKEAVDRAAAILGAFPSSR